MFETLSNHRAKLEIITPAARRLKFRFTFGCVQFGKNLSSIVLNLNFNLLVAFVMRYIFILLLS